MTLEQIKDELAKEHGFNNLLWNEKENQFINEVAKRYATACVKASLEKAKKSARIYLATQSIPEGTKVVKFTNAEFSLSVDELSITNPDNIVLL